jgi:polyphosphate kinase 2 (PPK2 family)
MKPPSLEKVDLSLRLTDKNAYEGALHEVQMRLLQQQQRYRQEQRRAVIVLEGWDASGKGGAIRRLTEKLDPRGVNVWPIAAPRPDEQARHYLYRFWKKVPSPATWAVFDRSWYGRVLVERVEKLAPKPAWKRAYREINAFERMLTDDGVTLVKLFLHVSKSEQLVRFKERESNPYKRWKIGKEDWQNRKQWPHYEKAIAEMFEKTSTEQAPWTPVAGNYKWYARVAVCRAVADALEAST